jgi:hypothetical protein
MAAVVAHCPAFSTRAPLKASVVYMARSRIDIQIENSAQCRRERNQCCHGPDAEIPRADRSYRAGERLPLQVARGDE